MASIQSGIQTGKNDSVSFGNYEVTEKIKAKLEIAGDEYYVKTHNEITKLEKNGMLLIETVPGAAIFDFSVEENIVSFFAEGKGNTDTQITLELLPNCDYSLVIDGETIGTVKTNRSGKAAFSIELSSEQKSVTLKK